MIIREATKEDVSKIIPVWRELMVFRAGRGEVVDHINHNALDNRRCNLRVCSQAENVRNRRGLARRTSRYKGVSLNRKSGKWVAAIRREGRSHYLGLFDSETDAARAYNEKARELFREFAYLNDVPPSEPRHNQPRSPKKVSDPFISSIFIVLVLMSNVRGQSTSGTSTAEFTPKAPTCSDCRYTWQGKMEPTRMIACDTTLHPGSSLH